MPAHFGGGREHPQILVGQFEAAAIAEGNLHETGLLVHLDFSGDRRVLVKAAHGGLLMLAKKGM